MAPYMRASIFARLDRKDEAEAAIRKWLKQDPRSNAYDRLILSHALLARLGKVGNAQNAQPTKLPPRSSCSPVGRGSSFQPISRWRSSRER
jgi:hypothetical protein